MLEPQLLFKQEILDYINIIETEIENINKQGGVKFQKIKKTLLGIIGISNINGYGIIEELLLQLLVVLDGISDGRYKLSRKHLDLTFVTGEYVKEILKWDYDKLDNFPLKNIRKAFENSTKNLTIDVNRLLISDLGNENSLAGKHDMDDDFDSSKDVKVSIQNIDNMITQMNQLILNQYQLKIKMDEIGDLQSYFDRIIENKEDLGGEAERGRRRLLEVNSEIKNQFLKFEQNAFSLQENVLAMRMFPLMIIKDQIEEYIKQQEEILGKKIELEIINSSITIDKVILQGIISPILEIIKNSMEHGFEEDLLTEGISQVVPNKISINIYEESGKVSIEISDNGRGIDFPLLRQKCLELYPHERDKIADLPENKLVRYLFMEGVTTLVDDVHGGQGLAIANDQIEQVKGALTLFSKFKQGVQVKITIPKSLTTIYGYFVLAGGEKFFIPSLTIREIITVNKVDVLDLVTKQAVRLRDEIVPIYPLVGILNNREPLDAEQIFVVVVHLYDETIGIVVDEVLYHASAIYKQLPQNLKKMKNIQGVVYDENFKVINILYIPQIVEHLKSISDVEFKERYSSKKMEYKRILIIDDSSVNRDIERNILERDKYNVDLATDGIEALQKVRDKYYHLIITDTEMPRMDGLTFMENLRREKSYVDTPVIVISSSHKQSEVKKYMDAGAAFVYFKYNFDRDLLLENVKMLLR